MAQANKGGEKKGKSMQLWKLYDKGKKKNKFCPKCGVGTFMANHKSRWTCGKCNYSEMKGKVL